MAKTQKEKNQHREVIKGWTFFLVSVALAVKLLLASIAGVHLPDGSIDIVVNVILALAGSFGAFRNNYITKIGLREYQILRNNGLQHFFKKL